MPDVSKRDTMKTLNIEQISALQTRHEMLVATARAGARLASFCRGAIRGCDPHTDPGDKIKTMLTGFLDMAGFASAELPAADEEGCDGAHRQT
jgi:hypothetical protein